MDNTRQGIERLVGYDVVDARGNKIGSVENVWVDGATQQLEFVGVKTGAVLGRTHIVPVADAQIDEAQRRVRVPYSEDQIKAAPQFDRNAELSDDDEYRVYSHYGIDRSKAPSPTGLPGGAGTMAERPRARTTDRAEDRRTVELREEELRARKQPVEAGEVGIRKEVVTEQQTMDVPVTREEVTIERRPTEPRPADRPIGEGEEIRVPVREEQVRVEKEPVVREEIDIGKRQVQETERVSGEVRREEARIERQGDVDLRGTDAERRRADRDRQPQ